MKCLPLLAALALAVLARADTFLGSITWTLNTVSQPTSSQIGDSFTGWYSYNSPTIDGIFFEHGLTGGVNVPTWMTPDGFVPFADVNNSLQVIDGVPTFIWGSDWLNLSMNFYPDTMNFNVQGDPGVVGSGSVIFGAPVDQTPQPIPDGGNTLGLLGLAVAVIAMFRRRFKFCK